MVSGDSGIIRSLTVDFVLIWLRVSVERGGIHNPRNRAESRDPKPLWYDVPPPLTEGEMVDDGRASLSL